MASSHFIVHVGGIEEVAPYHFNIQGSFFVLSGSDIKAPSSYNVYAITQDNNGEPSLVPLQNAGKDENSSLYVLDAKLSVEYVAFVDHIDLLSTSPVARKKEEIVIVDLTSDDEAINNDRAEPQKGSIVEVIDCDSPAVQTNTCIHQTSPPKFSIIKLTLDPNMRSPKLRKMVASSTWERVNEIPCRYNGNVVFELPTQANSKITSMEGIEQAIDGHVWTKPTTTNITFSATIQKSYCGGDFECLTLDDQCEEVVPRTNLSESRHASWLAGEGYKQKISLYDATVSDIGNTLLQQEKCMAYTEVQSTCLPRMPEVRVDNVTVTKRQKSASNVTKMEANSSHRPEYVIHNVPRQRKARKLSFGGSSQAHSAQSGEEEDPSTRRQAIELSGGQMASVRILFSDAFFLLLLAILLLQILLVSTALSNEEGNILIQIKESLLGSKGGLNTWNKDVIDPCGDWQGIVCQNGHVTGVTLSMQGLSGTLSKAIGSLQHLQLLIIQDNMISGHLPGELGNLSQLNTLKAQNNRFDGVIPSSLGNLGQLKTL
ncbi:hypothetical protein L7F22_040706 [Adiantum nelumboides]|nr:hypothetical protein [Adiantum nelumboides]